MTLQWIDFRGVPYLELGVSFVGYLVAVLYGGAALLFLIRTLPTFNQLTARRWILLAALLVLTPLLTEALVLRFDGVNMLPSGPPRPPVGPTLAALGVLPILIAALWLGTGPAILVGLAAGLAAALLDTFRLTQPFEVALLGAALAFMLNQRYRGLIGSWLRRPLVAAFLGAVFIAWPLTLVGMFATGQASALVSLEQTVISAVPALLALAGSALVAGGILQVVLINWPDLSPVSEDDLVSPPWRRHLSRRMFFIIVPMAVVGIIALVGVVAFTSYYVASRLVIDQMARDAANASSGVPFFVQWGRSLIRETAQDNRLLQADDASREERLGEAMRAIPFFRQLIYFDQDGQPVTLYPPAQDMSLAPEEEDRVRFALEGSIPAEVVVYDAESDPSIYLSFVAPVADPATGDPVAALLGRSTLNGNPTLTPVEDVLRGVLVDEGEGFIIGESNTILLYPSHPEQQGQTFSLESAVSVSGGAGGGRAYRQREADGTRQLVYLLSIAGHSEWSVVVVVPNEIALALAVQIALPTLALLLVLAALAVPLVIAVTRYITVPLETLVGAADYIAEGQLDQPVLVAGEDEVGRLGLAFEGMRRKLKARLGEQARLLEVSRSVSSSLELFRSMPPILSSALEVTNAAGVRLALCRPDDVPLQTYAAGEAAAGMAPLDEQLIARVEQEGTIVVSQLWRAVGALDTGKLSPRIKSLVALPLRGDTSFHGVLWLGYDHEHEFEESELTFISTLAGQAAIAVSNARLFAEAESRRRRLEAILQSTADAVLVTDTDGKILLMNPAAEKHFGLREQHVRGRRAVEVLGNQELGSLLTDLREPSAVLETFNQDADQAFLSSISTIVSPDGVIGGRVAVLRDVTHLKELDNLKTVFLRMVSHDLRSPLTWMRGYTSMLPLTGDLNDRQEEAVRKITEGIELITEFTERLHNLSRLQFGAEADLDLELIDVEELLQVAHRARSDFAASKDIELCLTTTADRLPFIKVDETLVRQSLVNMVDNAIKYTPEGGRVETRITIENDERIVVSVRDNGIGIRPEDQQRIFEPFYRVPQREGEPRRPTGTGIGLALIKAVARAHGGEVGFTSEFGKGSTFWMSIPVYHPSPDGED